MFHRNYLRGVTSIVYSREQPQITRNHGSFDQYWVRRWCSRENITGLSHNQKNGIEYSGMNIARSSDRYDVAPTLTGKKEDQHKPYHRFIKCGLHQHGNEWKTIKGISLRLQIIVINRLVICWNSSCTSQYIFQQPMMTLTELCFRFLNTLFASNGYLCDIRKILHCYAPPAESRGHTGFISNVQGNIVTSSM